jgi:hypothetical protein
MARTAIPVDMPKLKQAIEQLETAQPGGVFPNRSALWDAVANHSYAKGIGLSAQVAMLRCKKEGYNPKTPVGLRGRQKGCAPVQRTGTSRKRKRIPMDMVDVIKKTMPESMHRRIDAAANGSLKAAVGVFCVQCSGNSKKEAAQCVIRSCPLWGFRPFQAGV